MKRALLLIFALIVSIAGSAQQNADRISVSSFRLLDNDLVARTSVKTDQNGEPCAVIKVVVQAGGFIFEGDGLGIVSSEYKTGEYWLYVPYGARHLTIKHADFGVLRQYAYPVRIEKLCTYELVLSTSSVAEERLQDTEAMLEYKNLIFTVNGCQFSMVYVDGGSFNMGATSEQGSDAEPDEKPVRNVAVGNFYIGKFEVTQGLWRAVMGNNPSQFQSDDNFPVENVSWNDCQTFIAKLNQLTGRTFRLPTEAEWEYSARGGRMSRGYKYAGGNSVRKVAWLTGNSRKKTHSVGQKWPNELGLYEMSGNVWEWCQDWYDACADTYSDSVSDSVRCGRILRGGAWSSNARHCRVSYRNGINPDYKYGDFGLRLCLSAE